jgi:hypothetical protein
MGSESRAGTSQYSRGSSPEEGEQESTGWRTPPPVRRGERSDAAASGQASPVLSARQPDYLTYGGASPRFADALLRTAAAASMGSAPGFEGSRLSPRAEASRLSAHRAGPQPGSRDEGSQPSPRSEAQRASPLGECGPDATAVERRVRALADKLQVGAVHGSESTMHGHVPLLCLRLFRKAGSCWRACQEIELVLASCPSAHATVRALGHHNLHPPTAQGRVAKQARC